MSKSSLSGDGNSMDVHYQIDFCLEHRHTIPTPAADMTARDFPLPPDLSQSAIDEILGSEPDFPDDMLHTILQEPLDVSVESVSAPSPQPSHKRRRKTSVEDIDSLVDLYQHVNSLTSDKKMSIAQACGFIDLPRSCYYVLKPLVQLYLFHQGQFFVLKEKNGHLPYLAFSTLCKKALEDSHGL